MSNNLRDQNSKAINKAIRRDGNPPIEQRHFRQVESIGAINTVSTTVLDTILTPFSIKESKLAASNFQVHVAYSDVLLSQDSLTTVAATLRDDRLSADYDGLKGFIVADQFKNRDQHLHATAVKTTLKIRNETSGNITVPARFAADLDILTYPNSE